MLLEMDQISCGRGAISFKKFLNFTVISTIFWTCNHPRGSRITYLGIPETPRTSREYGTEECTGAKPLYIMAIWY